MEPDEQNHFQPAIPSSIDAIPLDPNIIPLATSGDGALGIVMGLPEHCQVVTQRYLCETFRLGNLYRNRLEQTEQPPKDD